MTMLPIALPRIPSSGLRQEHRGLRRHADSSDEECAPPSPPLRGRASGSQAIPASAPYVLFSLFVSKTSVSKNELCRSVRARAASIVGLVGFSEALQGCSHHCACRPSASAIPGIGTAFPFVFVTTAKLP